MTDLRRAAEMALEALKQAKDRVADWGYYASYELQTKNDLQGDIDEIQEQITALRTALAHPKQRGMKKLEVTLVDRPIDVELAQYKRMFEAACSALGAIGDAIGVDPEEGGAEPILAAIAELKAAQPEQKSAVYQCPRCATSMDVDLNAKHVDTVNTSQERETAKREHEVVAWDGACILGHCDSPSGCETSNCCRANYTAPPKREWVGLTDEQVFAIADGFGSFQYGDAQGNKRLEFARAIEAKLKEKNT